MIKVLVTGASGQLGQCFKKFASRFPELDFTFCTSQDLDITQFGVVSAFLRKNEFDYCINCAAYTAVEQAEKEQEMAYLVNGEAVKNLAELCSEYGITLIHFSTDYVFDGKKSAPYNEEEDTDPLNVYGASKLLGEDYIKNHLEEYFIFRTSWLYSDIGNNFLNTIRKKIEQGEPLNITTTQQGTPTNAYDLACYVLELVAEGNTNYGIYHYSNLGEGTWYDFAKEILSLSGKQGEINLNENNDFITLAERPAYSVLSKNKTLRTFKRPISSWKESLARLYKGDDL